MNHIEITADDPILGQINFRKYRYTTKRRAEEFLPDFDQPQTIEVETSWGGTLIGKRGDFLVSEWDEQEDKWVVEREIFQMTYREVEYGVYVKKATVDLVPLVEITSDPNQLVIVHSMDGPLEVQAGDFYLARGVKDEIWPVPKETVQNSMEPVE